MQKEIQYNGYAARPSDRAGADGELSLALNMVNDGSGLEAVPQPYDIAEIPPYYRVLYLHTSTAFSHVILQSTQSRHALRWFDRNNPTYTEYVEQGVTYRILDTTYIQVPAGFGEVLEITSVGNTLVLMMADGINYVKWDSLDGNYEHLGTQPPSVDIQFSTSRNKPLKYNSNTEEYALAYVSSVKFIWDDASMEYSASMNNGRIEFLKAAQPSIKSAVWTAINKGNQMVSKEGHFYAPFLVRYCYRLYDGSTTIMHSAPVYMPISTPNVFDVVYASLPLYDSINIGSHLYPGDTSAWSVYLTFLYYAKNIALTYMCDDSRLDKLKSKWGDIVKSIDIYVSRPLYPEDTTRDVETASPYTDEKHQSFTFRDTTSGGTELNYGSLAEDVKHTDLIYSHNGTYINPTVYYVCDIPNITDKDYLDKIKSVDNFYKVKSFNLKEDTLSATWAEVDISSDVLPNLTVQETMTDDYKTHNSLLPSYDYNGRCISDLYAYNARLNVSGVREKLFGGFDFWSNTAYISQISTLIPGQSHVTHNTLAEQKVLVYGAYVYTNTEYGTKIVYMPMSKTTRGTPSITATNEAMLAFQLMDMPLFYPDNRAYKMVVVYKAYDGSAWASSYSYLTLYMEQCPMINGAFTHGGVTKVELDTIPGGSTTTTIPPELEHYSEHEDELSVVPIENKLYTSEVNNPFFFPVTGINTIGTGTILAVRAVTKALSEGQFGQFPLYAFCSDGVWALTVNDDGSFAPAHPVTRDICTNPDSVTQTDDAILFATARGVMLLRGGDTKCITDMLGPEMGVPLTALPHIAEVATLAGIDGRCIEMMPFRTFLEGCRMVYDYRHQHVILFHADTENVHPYNTYVLSMKSGLWGMMQSGLKLTVNSYPDALAVTHDNHLVSFSDPLRQTGGDGDEEEEARYIVGYAIGTLARVLGESDEEVDPYEFVLSLQQETEQTGTAGDGNGGTTGDPGTGTEEEEEEEEEDTDEEVADTVEPTVKCLAVTRPLKLGAGDVLKSVHTLIQRGLFERGAVKTVLWGSRDMQHWVLAGSSVTEELRHLRGSGYKWFRIGVVAELKEGETVEGATAEFNIRQTDVMR